MFIWQNSFFTIVNILYGLPDYAGEIKIYSTAGYFTSATLFLTLWLYQNQFLDQTVLTRTITVLISTSCLFYTAAVLFNLYRPILFLITNEGVYSDSVIDYVSAVLDFFLLTLLCVAAFFSKLSINRKLSFLCCIFAPTLFTVLSLNLNNMNPDIYVFGAMTATIILPMCLIFYNTNDELEKDAIRREKEQMQLQVSVMISQMQPHFLYNSLAVIAALCEEDSKLAAQAANAFADYLRENIGFANKSNPISILEELEHVKTYVWLEQLRFPNKLNIEYDIQCDSFQVPALSVQPMVENAIKHGICKTRDGGTVRIRTFETDRYYRIVVSDDGTGFDVSQTIDDGRQHLGIENTRHRVREMVGGSLDIESMPGRGTTVTITIPK